jgi:hypothetical protein
MPRKRKPNPMLLRLRATFDPVLIDGLPDSLKQSIDSALRLGATHDEILIRTQAACGGTITAAAVEAYLRSLPPAEGTPENPIPADWEDREPKAYDEFECFNPDAE